MIIGKLFCFPPCKPDFMIIAIGGLTYSILLLLNLCISIVCFYIYSKLFFHLAGNPSSAIDSPSRRMRLYKCERCNSQYFGLASLRSHCRSVHGDQKYYKCHVCSKLFSHPSSRNIHLRLHSGEKPYQCDTCGKRFRVSSHLKDHVRVHTGEYTLCSVGNITSCQAEAFPFL